MAKVGIGRGVIQLARCLTLLSLVCACSCAAQGWQHARSQNTVLAYEMFLDAHPYSQWSVPARKRIEVLQDAGAWSRAARAGTLGAYVDYLRWRPSGAHAAQARSCVAVLLSESDSDLRHITPSPDDGCQTTS